MKRLNFIILAIIIGILSLACGVSAAQQITISNVVMNADGSGTATVTMDNAPTGLSGFKLGLFIMDSTVSDNITLVTYPSGDTTGFNQFDTKGSTWASAVFSNNVNTLTRGGFSSGYVKAVDTIGESYPDGSTNILLATVTLHGLKAGSTTLHGTLQILSSNSGVNYIPTTTVNDGTITVNGPPTAAFTSNVISGTAPLDVKFTDQSTGSPTSWSWDFNNDGTPDSTDQNPVHTYPIAGSYTVKLTVVNGAGSNFVTHSINVNAAPVAPTAAFTFTPNYLVVQFTDQSTGSPTSWAWDFNNDGAPDRTEQNPSHAFAAAGTYLIKLTATNDGGSTFVTHDVTVEAAPVPVPVVDFIGAPRTGDTPLSVQFNGSATNSPSAWAWDFQNDGIIDSTVQNASFTFTVPGTYQVRLNATNSGGTGTKLKGNYITVTGEDPNLPGTDFKSDVRTGFAPLTVHFTDNSTNSPTAWAWDFQNDGVIDSNEQNPTFIYTTAGQFPVNLTATNSAGSKTRLKSNWMTVNEEVIPPVALFSTNVTSGTIPLAVQFNETATGTAPLEFAWDFGDGAISSERNPVHVFTTAGTQTAKLTVTNAAGNNYVTHDVVVAAAPVAPTAAFTTSATGGVVPLFVRFNDTSSESPTSWLWDFGDGITSSNRNTTHTYMAAGTYTVILTATSSVGSDNEVKMDLITVTTSGSPYTDSAWPKFQQNNYNTGRSPYTGPQMNTTKWNFTAGTGMYYPVIGSDGTIYARSNDNKFYAISPDGTEKWNYTLQDRTVSAPAIGSDGTVYIVGGANQGDNFIYAINPNGTLKWSFATNWFNAPESITIGNDGTLYFADAVQFYALNPNGTQKWTFGYGFGQFNTNPAIGPDGTIYTSTTSQTNPDFFALNPDGTVKWTFFATGQFRSSAAIGQDGTIYVGNNDKKLYALFPNGTQKWSYTTGNYVQSSPAIGSDGTIYFGSNDKKIYALNPSGTLKWSYTTAGTILSSPTVGADGTVYFGSSDKKFYALTPEGTLKWSYISAGTFNTGAAIAPDGTLYAGANDGNLYAFHDPITPVAAFISDTQIGAAPLTVTFTDQSANKPTSWAWDFGDGDATNATKQNPVHIYATAGTYTVKFTATNGAGSDDETKTNHITVSPQPKPVAAFTSDIQAGTAPLTVNFTDESTGYSITSWAWDFGDGDATNATVQSPIHTFASAGTFTVKHAATNAGGSDDEIKTNYITVSAPNTAPVANAQSVTTDKNVAKEITLTGSDVDGNTLTFIKGTGPAHGTLGTISASGVVTYTPTTGYVGTDSFTFTVNDGLLGSDLATVDITVNAVNTAPVANAQSVTTDKNVAKEITLTGSDVDGNTLSFIKGTGPTHGTLGTISASGVVTYTPTTGYVGTDSFTFTVNDGLLGSDLATVDITVNAVNTAPVANAQSVSTDKNVAKEITLTGSDVDGNTLTFIKGTGPAHGSLGTISASGVVTYTPTTGYVGTDSFTFTVNDGFLGSNPATVDITVNAMNTAPVANAQSVTTDKNVAKEITLTGSDVDGNTLTFIKGTGPAHGSLGTISASGVVTYTPTTGYVGTDSFTFTVNDGFLGSDPATVDLTVNAVNTAPVANAQSVTTDKNVAKEITLTGSDVDGNTLTFIKGTGPSHGTLGTISSSGVVTYTPTTGYVGTDSFTFTVNDGFLGSNPATVDITVNDAQSAGPVAAFRAEDLSVVRQNQEAKFIDKSVGSSLTYAWDFGDGSTSSEQNPAHIYKKEGVYPVTLTVSNALGSDTITKKDYLWVTQPNPLKPNFDAAKKGGSSPLMVQFTDSSKVSVTMPSYPVVNSWTWDFGDDSVPSTEQNPTHSYAQAGSYTVTLTISNTVDNDSLAKTGFITVK